VRATTRRRHRLLLLTRRPLSGCTTLAQWGLPPSDRSSAVPVKERAQAKAQAAVCSRVVSCTSCDSDSLLAHFSCCLPLDRAINVLSNHDGTHAQATSSYRWRLCQWPISDLLHSTCCLKRCANGSSSNALKTIVGIPIFYSFRPRETRALLGTTFITLSSVT